MSESKKGEPTVSEPKKRRKRKVGLSIAALLLSETVACNPVQICDPVPPPPQLTSIAATQTAIVGTQTAVAATQTAVAATQTGIAGTQTTVVPTPKTTSTQVPTATLTPMANVTASPTVPIPICDAVPPPPELRTAVAATRTARAEPTMQICDPVPPPPVLTEIAATAEAEANREATPEGEMPPAVEKTPQAEPQPVETPTPQAALPLQQRLRLRIVALGDGEHAFRVVSNFPLRDVSWIASGGSFEICEGGVRWIPPTRRGSYLIQAVVDAGEMGVAVDSVTVTARAVKGQ